MRSPLARFVLLVALVAAGLIAAYQLGLVDWLREGSVQERVLALRGQWWTPLALFGLIVLAGFLPLPTTAAVLVAGAVYGPLRGWLLNWIACMAAAAVGYALARVLGRDFVARILGPERWARLDGMMNQHGFWAMARARLMLPLSVVNYGAGVSGMRALPFLGSSILGMTLPIGVYTYVGHLLLTATTAESTRALRNGALIVIALLAMSMTGPAMRWWRRRGETET
jgi:uncharacterized membrane protein YdjX (TVP38/TMEM64 family)